MDKNKNSDCHPESELIETVSLYQSQEKIYTRAFSGFYRNLRNIGGTLLFLLYFGTVWLSWDGRQAVLWDLSTRQFHIFGTTFLPQDFVLLTCLLIILAFGLFFVTVVAGRIWCGFVCPQSVFTWVFLWVERISEGDRNQRIRLDSDPMGLAKFLRKLLKHTLWLAIALITAITFVGYFTPIRTLIQDLVTIDASGWALFWVAFFTLATYINAGWMREQVCIYMCPYARFQSVMYDKDTLTVHYRTDRGEPRGARKRSANPKELGLGDCIDCTLCVQVCPTGIDIREGLQYECISCGACVDVCNSIMDKMDYERGLITYTSENALAGKTTKVIRPRMIGYCIALATIISAFTYMLINRPLLEVEVLRDRQSLYQESSDGKIENVYVLKMVSKAPQPERVNISVIGLPGATLSGQTTVTLHPGTVESLPVRLAVSAETVAYKTNTTITFRVTSVNPESSKIKLSKDAESRFLSPAIK